LESEKEESNNYWQSQYIDTKPALSPSLNKFMYDFTTLSWFVEKPPHRAISRNLKLEGYSQILGGV